VNQKKLNRYNSSPCQKNEFPFFATIKIWFLY
jgi:hypothetical protein